MKIVSISDVHGQDIWKRIVDQEKQADIWVFLGDYFDTFQKITTVEQVYNFKEIVEFKKTCSDKVVMLTGNHDVQYFTGATENCSGYQRGGAPYITQVLTENMEHLQMCFTHGNIVFTHAGITKTFLRRFKIKNDKNLEQSLNDLLNYKPNAFNFCGNDNYGDDITQSPIWVRPNSLIKDAIPKKIQVVGHTRMSSGIENHGDFWFTDTLEDYTKQYLRITDGNFEVVNLE